MKLGEMTWPDAKALDRSNIVPVYPIASFGQHGPHLPFLTDTLETEEIVKRLERRLPDDVLCLPTQWLGYSFHHTRLGCLTAKSETHINLITETVGCLIEAGFPKVMSRTWNPGPTASSVTSSMPMDWPRSGDSMAPTGSSPDTLPRPSPSLL